VILLSSKYRYVGGFRLSSSMPLMTKITVLLLLWSFINQSGNRDMNNPLYPPLLRGNSDDGPFLREISVVPFDKGESRGYQLPEYFVNLHKGI
jgi:hypothetical protein